ncbi:Carboxylesterase 5A [Chamberlinius hualienensis]
MIELNKKLLFAVLLFTVQSKCDDNQNLLIENVNEDENEPIIEIENGKLRGTVSNSLNGRKYYSFRGIPFAKPPIGPLRFKNPEPAQDWSGILNATKSSPICAQIMAPPSISSEDCLYLDVHSTNIDRSLEPLPVIVYIYGGGFIVGSFLLYGPQRLLNKDVVVVFFNYRVGALGFLSTGDSASPGNYAFFDQALALKWVKQNIRAFGGDPNRVTIVGHSSGSVSVSAHLISPVSKGYFHSAVIESGTILLTYGFEDNPLAYASKLANVLGCPIDDTKKMIDCFRNVPVQNITAHSIDLRGDILVQVPFPPCVDGVFITKDPYQLFATGKINKVPTVFGGNINEGLFIYDSTKAAADFTKATAIDSYLKDIIKKYLTYFRYTTNSDELAAAVAEQYYGKIDMTNVTAVQFATIDLFSDVSFTAKTYLADLLATYNGVPSYFYSFQYAGTGSTRSIDGQKFVNHGDQDYYAFFVGNGYFTPEDQLVSDRYIDIWYNMADKGNPGDYFKPTTVFKEFDYLKIGNDGTFTMANSFRAEFMRFWNIKVPLIMRQRSMLGLKSWWLY